MDTTRYLRIAIKDNYGRNIYCDSAQEAYTFGWHQALCMRGGSEECRACAHADEEYGNGQDTEAT